MKQLRAPVVFAFVICLVAGPARAFTLLDYKTQADIMIGKWFDWVNPRTGVPRCPGGRGQPFTITYRIDPSFLSNQPPPVREAAPEAIRAAMQTWSNATNGFLRFRQADWAPVVNADSTPKVYFDGPSIAEWQGCTTGCTSCWPTGPCPDVLPGWGANIDFYSRPAGWQLTSNGLTYLMSSGVLAFAAVHRSQDGIFTTDIYLNNQFQWTADGESANRIPLGFRRPMCGCGVHEGVDPAMMQPVVEDMWSTVAAGTLYDIETVVLHELGHALGLDHPNEACSRGGAQLDPYTYAFVACGQASSQAVMNGAYTGVKRSLTADDIGGISFLYRPSLWGDLDSDHSLTILDALRALDLLVAGANVSPYTVNTMDFLTRNGRVDLDEIVQVVEWAINPSAGTPGQVNSKPPFGNAPPSPSVIVIDSVNVPLTVGEGSTFQLAVTLENPDMVRINGWDLELTYNTSIFSNPRISNGDFLAGAVWVPTGPDDGNIQFAKLGIGSFDDAASGVLGVVTFDVNLAAAGVGPPVLTFQFLDVQLVADEPSIHVYGSVPEYPETLIVEPGIVNSYRYDANGDGVVTLEDLYAFGVLPLDVNRDTQINQTDRELLQGLIRRDESADIHPAP